MQQNLCYCENWQVVWHHHLLEKSKCIVGECLAFAIPRKYTYEWNMHGHASVCGSACLCAGLCTYIDRRMTAIKHLSCTKAALSLPLQYFCVHSGNLASF